MKLTNHNKDNAYHLNTYVMSGTIEMTQAEWTKAYLWLWGQYQKAIKSIDTYKRDSLASLKRDKGRLFSAGVLATKLIAEHYHLKGYKNQNYGIKII